MRGRGWAAEIREADLDLHLLLSTIAPELLDRYGVGPTLAALLLITAGDNPERIRSERAFAMLCRPDPRQLRPHRPTPAQPRRRPTSQRRRAHRRDMPLGQAAAHPRHSFSGWENIPDPLTGANVPRADRGRTAQWIKPVRGTALSYQADMVSAMAMAKTQYYTATSIDGYIADSDNRLDWLFEADASRDGSPFESFFADVGAFAMGATTYEWVLEHESLLDHPNKWASFYGDVPAWVFTHRTLPVIPGARLSFVCGDVRPVHAAMVTAAGGKNVWIVGGGELAGAFVDAGLLDELILGVAQRQHPQRRQHAGGQHDRHRQPQQVVSDDQPARAPPVREGQQERATQRVRQEAGHVSQRGQ
jgi:dihydrofolate reductase